jgi:sirohydrochlorin cobaltochelatase
VSARALIVLAHGARELAWTAPLEALAARLRALAPGIEVRTAFLERFAPRLDEAIHAAAMEGAREILLLPVFWAPEGQVLHELPPLVAEAERSGLTVRVMPTLSELPGLLDFVARAAAAAAARPPSAKLEDRLGVP